MQEEVIYHIVHKEEWDNAQLSGEYKHPTLATEGFIHCSTAAQLEKTANRYFTGQSEILILKIDATRVKSEIKYELATIGEWFPHIYGPLNIDSVVKIFTVVLNQNGKYIIPLNQ